MKLTSSKRVFDSCFDNRKSKTCPFDILRAGSELGRRIQNRKLVGIVAFVVTFAMCGARAEAQQATKVPRIGFLDVSTASGSAVLLEAFRQEMSKFGWIEGKNITIEYRFAEQKRERLPELAAELMRLKIDVIVTGGAGPMRSAKEATVTIPIVMAQDPDPVGNGFVASLARPGGNVTGLSSLSPELSTKRLEVLRTRFPGSPELEFCCCQQTA